MDSIQPGPCTLIEEKTVHVYAKGDTEVEVDLTSGIWRPRHRWVANHNYNAESLRQHCVEVLEIIAAKGGLPLPEIATASVPVKPQFHPHAKPGCRSVDAPVKDPNDTKGNRPPRPRMEEKDSQVMALNVAGLG